MNIWDDVDQPPRLKPVQHGEEDVLNRGNDTQYRPIEQSQI